MERVVLADGYSRPRPDADCVRDVVRTGRFCCIYIFQFRKKPEAYAIRREVGIGITDIIDLVDIGVIDLELSLPP